MSAHLVLVDDGVPSSTIELLLEAARRRALTTEVVRAADPAASRLSPLAAGTLLYRPAVSRAARRAERRLIGPGVISFYASPDGPFFDRGDPIAAYLREGLPTVPDVRITTRRRQTLEEAVDTLGGFPLVVKVPGGEGGVGVLQVDSRPALFSLVDFLLAHGHSVQLQQFIPDGQHVRAVVVGNSVVTAYRNIIDPDDFRTSPSRDIADYHLALSPALSQIAVNATHLTGVEFAGVDLLLDCHGTPYVLEANFPCFHAQAERVAGAPVSAAMIDYLMAKRAQWLGEAA